MQEFKDKKQKIKRSISSKASYNCNMCSCLWFLQQYKNLDEQELDRMCCHAVSCLFPKINIGSDHHSSHLVAVETTVYIMQRMLELICGVLHMQKIDIWNMPYEMMMMLIIVILQVGGGVISWSL